MGFEVSGALGFDVLARAFRFDCVEGALGFDVTTCIRFEVLKGFEVVLPGSFGFNVSKGFFQMDFDLVTPLVPNVDDKVVGTPIAGGENGPHLLGALEEIDDICGEESVVFGSMVVIGQLEYWPFS